MKFLYYLGAFSLIFVVIIAVISIVGLASDMTFALIFSSPFLIMTARDYFNIAFGKSGKNIFSNLSVLSSIILLIILVSFYFIAGNSKISEETIGLILTLPSMMPFWFILLASKIPKWAKYLFSVLLIFALYFIFNSF